MAGKIFLCFLSFSASWPLQHLPCFFKCHKLQPVWNKAYFLSLSAGINAGSDIPGPVPWKFPYHAKSCPPEGSQKPGESGKEWLRFKNCSYETRHRRFFFLFFFSETKGFCQQHAQSLDGTDWSPIGLKGKCSRHFSRASTAAGAASCWPIGTGGYFLFLPLNQFFNNSFMSLLGPSRETVCCFYRVHRQNEREWKAVFLTAQPPAPPHPPNPPRRLCQYMNLSASWDSIHLQLKVRGGSRDRRQRWLSEQIHTLPFKTKRLSQNMLHTSVK